MRSAWLIVIGCASPTTPALHNSVPAPPPVLALAGSCNDFSERVAIATCVVNGHATAYLVHHSDATHGTSLVLGEWDVQPENFESFEITGTTPHRIAISHTTGGLDNPASSIMTFYDPTTDQFTNQIIIGNTLEVTGGTVVRCRYSGTIYQDKTCAEQAGTIDIIPIE